MDEDDDRELSEHPDRRTRQAIARARRLHERASGRWVSYDDDDPAAEAEQLARDALAHLEGQRWDEARACAEAAQGLAEEHGEDAIWREFTLQVEEAAEIGRSAPS